MCLCDNCKIMAVITIVLGAGKMSCGTSGDYGVCVKDMILSMSMGIVPQR